MVNVIKLHKGLDIRLKGAAEDSTFSAGAVSHYALQPGSFVGLTPKVVVKVGDKVLAGDPLFVNKQCPEVRFASPVSGTVTAVVRGDRRKVLAVEIDADAEQKYHDFGKSDPAGLDAEGVKKVLLEGGLFGFINQLPYAVSTTPDTTPKAIFVSALRDMPLAGDFDYELMGQEEDFQAGITALSKIAEVHLGVGRMQSSEALWLRFMTVRVRPEM